MKHIFIVLNQARPSTANRVVADNCFVAILKVLFTIFGVHFILKIVKSFRLSQNKNCAVSLCCSGDNVAKAMGFTNKRFLENSMVSRTFRKWF